MGKVFWRSDNGVGIIWLPLVAIGLIDLQNIFGGGRGNRNPLPPGSYGFAHCATYVRGVARGGRGYGGPELSGIWQII